VGPSFRDATRVAGASSDVWTDIYMANREAIASEIDETAARLSRVADALRAGDPDAVREWNDAAAEDRRRLLEADLAGGVVHELRLTVPNKPGIVATVALALGRSNVNIMDMALAPAEDMRTGAMTLWISGDEEAERAGGLIEELGFPVDRS
jgi:prephenate dehydrogenase